MTSWGLLRRAEVQTARREFEAADASLAEAERIVPQLGLPEQIRALGLRAFLVLKSGRIDEAVTMADRAAELVRQAKTIHAYCIDPYGRIAEVHLAAWAKAGRASREAAAKARSSCATLRSAARIFPIAVPRYCLHEGTRRMLAGRRKSAEAIWKRGLTAARSLTIPYDEAFLLLALADLGSSGSANGNGVEQARRELKRLGVREGAIARA